MDIIIDFIKRPFIKRIFVLFLVGIMLFFLRSEITLFLLTFIFIYLINTAQKHINRLIGKYVKINRRYVIALLYLSIIGILFLLVYTYVPEIIRQITDIIGSVTYFISNYYVLTKTDSVILGYIYSFIEKIDLQSYIQSSSSLLLGIISNIGSASVNVLIAMILSLFFLLEKEKIIDFLKGFESSKISWFYYELKYFGIKFTNSFGKVLQTQILISLINSVISTFFLSFLHFPNIVGLFFMIFAFGLVPVAGVFVSLIPLLIIAYNIGGVHYIVYVIILIIILHSLESYFLNPKLMSHNTKLPVFVTFLVLIISERLMGIWGLFIGIPITMFFLDIFEIKTD